MENTDNIIKEFKQLLNQFLFENSSNPKFITGKTELSKEFINVSIHAKSIPDSKLLENFMKNQILISLDKFDIIERTNIAKIILKDENFIDGMIVLNVIQKKITSNIDLLMNKFNDEIEKFVLNGIVNFNIITYFKLYFEELFYTDFTSNSTINQSEYIEILNQFSVEKPLIKLNAH